jgi:hypothetical protein
LVFAAGLVIWRAGRTASKDAGLRP